MRVIMLVVMLVPAVRMRIRRVARIVAENERFHRHGLGPRGHADAPEVRSKNEGEAKYVVIGNTPEEFAPVLKADYEYVGRLGRELGIKAEWPGGQVKTTLHGGLAPGGWRVREWVRELFLAALSMRAAPGFGQGVESALHNPVWRPI